MSLYSAQKIIPKYKYLKNILNHNHLKKSNHFICWQTSSCKKDTSKAQYIYFNEIQYLLPHVHVMIYMQSQMENYIHNLFPILAAYMSLALSKISFLNALSYDTSWRSAFFRTLNIYRERWQSNAPWTHYSDLSNTIYFDKLHCCLKAFCPCF